MLSREIKIKNEFSKLNLVKIENNSSPEKAVTKILEYINNNNL